MSEGNTPENQGGWANLGSPKDFAVNQGVNSDWIEDDPVPEVKGKYEGQHLKFPLNIEAAEESHWIRFDMKEVTGECLQEGKDPREKAESGAGTNGGLGISESRSIVGRAGEALGGLASKAVTGVVQLGVGAVKSTINEFASNLPPGVSALGRAIFGGGPAKGRGKGSISLFSPHTRVENIRSNWAGESVGTVGAGMMAGGGTVESAVKGIWEKGFNASSLQGLRGQSAIVRGEVLGKIAGMAMGQNNLSQIDTRTRGAAVNPHIEMFFNGIDLRTFSFDFRMAPRNSPEAKEIQKIIHLFKYAAAPKLIEGEFGRYWRYPWIFKITFFNEDQTHKVQDCALVSISANHAGAGINSTFYDNYPVETTLNLTFTELDVLTKGKVDQGF